MPACMHTEEKNKCKKKLLRVGLNHQPPDRSVAITVRRASQLRHEGGRDRARVMLEY